MSANREQITDDNKLSGNTGSSVDQLSFGSGDFSNVKPKVIQLQSDSGIQVRRFYCMNKYCWYYQWQWWSFCLSKVTCVHVWYYLNGDTLISKSQGHFHLVDCTGMEYTCSVLVKLWSNSGVRSPFFQVKWNPCLNHFVTWMIIQSFNFWLHCVCRKFAVWQFWL